jgi:hypothetical protein
MQEVMSLKWKSEVVVLGVVVSGFNQSNPPFGSN